MMTFNKHLILAIILICCLFYCSKEGNDNPMGSMPEETDFNILIWDSLKSFNGTTLFGYDDNGDNHKIAEVSMDGNITWEYQVPGNGAITDIEYLDNGHILFAVKSEGIYEVDRNKSVTWSHTDNTVWHDVDRLSNGNTLYTCGMAEYASPYPYAGKPIIKEIDSSKNLVWQWIAKDHYINTVYDTSHVAAKYASEEWRGDWTHINGVERLTNGNTLISIRNFDLVIIVSPAGDILQEIGSGDPGWPILITLGLPDDPHNPVLLDNAASGFPGKWWNDGDMLISIPWEGRAIVMDTTSLNVKWEFPTGGWTQYGSVLFMRDARPLPNGNILINDATGSLIEVTQAGETVWNLQVKNYNKISHMTDYRAEYMIFFKMERYGCGFNLGW
ncbi:aryl-sulfate sulfotransferase [bacterium]